MAISNSTLILIAGFFGTISIGFGINAIIRPYNALEFFEFQTLASTADTKLIEGLMIVYGARDIYMGLSVYLAGFFGQRKSLGWLLLATAAIAFVDGYVCRTQVGKGEWNHWGYAPILVIIGSVLLGIFTGA